MTAIVTSVPDRLPLRGGDHVTHTITLTNNGPDDHPFLRLVTLLGGAASLDALIDPGTGAFSFVPPTTLTWTGPLAAGATTSLVLRVRIDDCFQTDRTALNSGSPVTVFNYCSQSVGSAQPPAPFALQRPVEATLTAVEARRTTQGTLPAIRYVVGRPGEPFDLQFAVRNNFPTDAAGVVVNAALPAGLSAVGNPPFVPPTDPGAAWIPRRVPCPGTARCRQAAPSRPRSAWRWTPARGAGRTSPSWAATRDAATSATGSSCSPRRARPRRRT